MYKTLPALLLLAAGLMARPIPIIFDTDIGDDIDDALALALALQSPELDVRLVTTVLDDTETRTRLAWKELGLYGRRDIALATGAPEPLLDPRRFTRARQFRSAYRGRRDAASRAAPSLRGASSKHCWPRRRRSRWFRSVP